LTKEEFEKKIKEGKFLEYAFVHGNYYGTLKETVEKIQNKGVCCIFDIDVNGAKTIFESGFLNPLVNFQINKKKKKFIFINVQPKEELEKRLRGILLKNKKKGRGSETEEAIQKRLSNAIGEIDFKNSELGKKIFKDEINNEEKNKSLTLLIDLINKNNNNYLF
jgi:guanylate kinase